MLMRLLENGVLFNLYLFYVLPLCFLVLLKFGGSLGVCFLCCHFFWKLSSFAIKFHTYQKKKKIAMVVGKVIVLVIQDFVLSINLMKRNLTTQLEELATKVVSSS